MEAKTVEKITLEAGSQEWVCLCGNTAADHGFYPCDSKGREIEPDDRWDGKLYVCARCNRIIDQETLEVVGEGVKVFSTPHFDSVIESTRPHRVMIRAYATKPIQLSLTLLNEADHSIAHLAALAPVTVIEAELKNKARRLMLGWNHLPELMGLAAHVEAMAGDAYLTGHPEWEEIAREAHALMEAVEKEARAS